MSETQFLALVQQHQGIIYKLVNLYAADPEEKRDLYQEILLQAWKGHASFRGEARFSTWLYRIALNTLLTHRRKVNPLDYHEDLEPIAGATTADPAADEQRQRLYKALRSLNETDRAIVTLHLEGYDNTEIGTIMGISSGNARVKLHRAKQELMNRLNPGYES